DLAEPETTFFLLSLLIIHVDAMIKHFCYETKVVKNQAYLDTLPSLKQMVFLDTSASNPDITIVGITLDFQFGNALPKNTTGCKDITVVHCAARRAYPRAVA